MLLFPPLSRAEPRDVTGIEGPFSGDFIYADADGVVVSKVGKLEL
jgi:hypothetical protein